MQVENSHYWLLPTLRTLVGTDCPSSRSTTPTGRARRTALSFGGYSPLAMYSQTSAWCFPPPLEGYHSIWGGFYLGGRVEFYQLYTCLFLAVFGMQMVSLSCYTPVYLASG